MPRLPSYFISHGGGPWPWMKDSNGGMFDSLEASLQAMAQSLPERPQALLVISGHWEEAQFTLSASPNPPMFYDYYGFPPHTYHIQYPAPGSPVLAQRVQSLLAAAGIEAKLDAERGFDHGTFCVAAPAFPEANIPLVQLSLRKDFDPAAHLALGRLLAPLRDEGVLIIGSGFSYHNLRLFSSQGVAPSRLFDDWLQTTLTHSSPEQRAQRLIDWQQAPAARLAHPREEHLIPLMVAVGAALEDEGTCVWHENTLYGGITASSFRFGAV